MDDQIHTVYGIEDCSKGLANVVAAISEASLPIHLPACGHYIGSLCVRHYISSIKGECLNCFTTENQHFVIVDLDGRNRERLYEVWIDHFEVAPALLSEGVSVFTTEGISAEIRKVITVEHTNHQKGWILALASLLARH